MKEAIYSWIKCLAIFYILLTMLLHLVPTEKYQRYVRFFMGLVLMVMLVTPVLSLLEKSRQLPDSFSGLYQQEEQKRLELEMENLQKTCWKQEWRSSLEKIFWKVCKEWHRSPVLRSTYRRGAFKSLCMDQRGAG